MQWMDGWTDGLAWLMARKDQLGLAGLDDSQIKV